jgi:F0F1-type ATP synthase membrane subunit b/b'
MATLELIPKVPVLIVQTGVFLANIVVVKKLFVDPYLKLQDRRDAMTIGNQEGATKILSECEQITRSVTTKLESAYAEAAARREVVRATTLAKKTEMLRTAETEARAYVEAIEKDIQQEVAREKQKIPAIVNSLTQEFYDQTLS